MALESTVRQQVRKTGLSEIQYCMLRNAFQREIADYDSRKDRAGYLLTFNVRQTTLDKLSGFGWIVEEQAYAEDERKYMTERIDVLIERAKNLLAEGNWRTAAVYLDKAVKTEQERDKLRWYLTDKARALFQNG